MNLGKETEILEFKKTTGELNEGIVSIASILNKHSKGDLYFGIKNDGTVIGQQIGEQTLRDVSKSISDNIEPQIYPVVKEVKLDGKSCIHVAFEGSDAPYFAFGRVRMRVADEDKKLTPAEVENYFRRKLSKISDWDSTPSGYDFGDIDEEKLKHYMRRANESGRLEYEYSTKEDILNKLDLLADGKPNNAAIAMFGNNSHLEIQMAIFATTEKLTFTDISRKSGTILELVDLGEKYIINNTRWRAVIDGSSLQRQEIPEIPIVAVREALYNSYAHKDFRVPQNNEISIYSNRIEIYNPGTFPPGLSPEDFLDGSGKSVHRNALLARIMYYSKDIENFGTGLKRIADTCNEANVKYEFVIGKLGFSVVFYRSSLHVSDNTDAPDNAPDASDNAPVNVTAQRILELIHSNPSITYNELAELLSLNRSSIMRNIRNLKNLGILERIGSDRLGYWKTNQD